MQQHCLFLAALVTTALPVSGQTPATPDQSKFAQVSGIVIDEQDGRLLRRVMVCLRRGVDTGYFDSRNAHCNETDTQGRFNIGNLTEARYAYSIEREGYFAAEPITDGLSTLIALKAGDDLRNVKLRMRRTGSIGGRVVFSDGGAFPGAELSLDNGRGNHETTGDTGEYRFGNLFPGDYRIVVNHPNFANCDNYPSRKPRLYVQRSGGVDPPPIHVDAGQEVKVPEMVMEEIIPHRVTGRLVWDNYPLPGLWRVSVGNNTVGASNSDGSFAICGLIPGEHTIRTNGRIDGRSVAGELKIRINDEDLKDVEIAPERSASIRARIDVEDNAPLDLSNANIYAISDSAPHDSVPQPRREADGAFVIDEVYTGEYRFFVSPLPPGSYLKSARLNGQDVLDAPLLVHGGENLDGLVFTVSPKASALTGVVKDETGNPVQDAIVILQPDPKHTDRDIHGCIRTADQNGGFSCDNLAPGKYRVGAWRTPAEFPQARNEVASRGTPVELLESGHVPVVLTVLKQ